MDKSLEETIADNAKAPAKASGDAGSVEQHSLSDQIAAAKFVAAKDATNKKHRGLRFNKLVPPGAE